MLDLQDFNDICLYFTKVLNIGFQPVCEDQKELLTLVYKERCWNPYTINGDIVARYSLTIAIGKPKTLEVVVEVKGKASIVTDVAVAFSQSRLPLFTICPPGRAKMTWNSFDEVLSYLYHNISSTSPQHAHQEIAAFTDTQGANTPHLQSLAMEQNRVGGYVAMPNPKVPIVNGPSAGSMHDAMNLGPSTGPEITPPPAPALVPDEAVLHTSQDFASQGFASGGNHPSNPARSYQPDIAPYGDFQAVTPATPSGNNEWANQPSSTPLNKSGYHQPLTGSMVGGVLHMLPGAEDRFFVPDPPVTYYQRSNSSGDREHVLAEHFQDPQLMMGTSAMTIQSGNKYTDELADGSGVFNGMDQQLTTSFMEETEAASDGQTQGERYDGDHDGGADWLASIFDSSDDDGMS